ncbi:MAG: hypothetical protein IPN76_00050 [Saprospiraceae bacterium]|nr:hypothetical protein [Saprospiraceae bacterium]
MDTKRIVEISKRYYLMPFILSQVILLIGIIAAAVKGTAKGVGLFYFWLIFTLIFLFFIGGLYHLIGEYWNPKRSRKMLRHEHLRRFLMYSFKYQDEIPGYEAVYRNFHAVISAHATAEAPEGIMVGCLVSVSEAEFDAVFDYVDKAGFELHGAGDSTAWIVDGIERKPFKGMPSFDEIKKKLDDLIFALERQQLKPATPMLISVIKTPPPPAPSPHAPASHPPSCAPRR